MDIDKLIVELQGLQSEGYGKLKAKFDFGACEVTTVYVEDDCLGDAYVHLDWA